MKRITAIILSAAAFIGCSYVGNVNAESLPSYPVQAVRMSLEGSVAVSIDCATKNVEVIRESTTGKYFSRQVKKQVANICHGESGTLDRVYVFKMNQQVGAHDMLVNNTNRRFM